MEIWKSIPEFEKSHEVSSFGNVRRIVDGKHLKPHADQRGYLRVKPNCITRKVHRLVAQAFLPNPEGKAQVNHKDTNKKNNHVSNLEWMTDSENRKHAVDNGIYKGNTGKYFMDSQRKVACYLKTGELVQEFKSIQEAARVMGADAPNICTVCKGINKTHKGYIWRYV